MHILAKRPSGFTLIEIMVATAIFALIGVGALSVLNTATTTSDKIKKDGDRLNAVQRAFLFISNDMQQLTQRRSRDEFGDLKPSMKSDLQAATPFIRLTRLGRRNPAQLPRSNLEHLIYTVEDKILYRTSYSYADGMPEDLGLKRPVLDAVEDLKISFFDGEQWFDYWPLSEDPSDPRSSYLPVAVKMNLELSDYGVIERLYAISDKLSALERRASDTGGGEGTGNGNRRGNENEKTDGNNGRDGNHRDENNSRGGRNDQRRHGES